MCEVVEDGEYMAWVCDFSIKVLFMGEVQQDYGAKIMVTLNRMTMAVIQVNVDKNNVMGECCENKLQALTSMSWCADYTCTSMLEGNVIMEREKPMYFMIKLMDEGLEMLHMKLMKVELGPFYPDIMYTDSSIPGYMVVGITSAIAQKNMVVSVITQLWEHDPSSSDGSRRNLYSLSEE